MEEMLRNFVRNIREMLDLLAADHVRQSAWLVNFFRDVPPCYSHYFKAPVHDDANTDELALSYNDIFVLAAQACDEGLITQEQYKALKVIDDKFYDFSGEEHGSLWTVRALREERVWAEIRELARHALQLLESAEDPLEDEHENSASAFNTLAVPAATVRSKGKYKYIVVSGKVLVIDRNSGKRIWQGCPGGNVPLKVVGDPDSDFGYVLLDPEKASFTQRFSNILCIDSSGKTVWKASMPTSDREFYMDIYLQDDLLIGVSFSLYRCVIDKETGSIVEKTPVERNGGRTR